MNDADRIASYDRLRKGRDLVRKTALLLSGGEPVEILFDRLAALLAEFVDASIVLVAAGSDAQARIVYVYQDGIGGRPDDDALRPGSVTEVVLQNVEVRLFTRREEWPRQSALTLNGRRLHLPESGIFVPILFGGTPVGVLSVQSRLRDAYDAEDAALLETCALNLGARIHDAQQVDESDRLRRLASTDALTGLSNRRAFDEAVVREWRRCARGGDSLSVALLDVDYFKAFNDAYGHIAGDTCLRQIAQAIAHALKRPGDLVARYGGEEFALILPGTDRDGAVRLCESVCEAVRALGIPHQGSSLSCATVSVGVFTTVPQAADDWQGAISLADALLYQAKNAGRNRVVADGYASQTPAATPRTVAHHNLPAPRSSFIGRVHDVEMIGESLRRGRLVTVVGPGGVGKTRTALEAARGALESFADGIWFVDLAPIADAALVSATIAAAAGLDLGNTTSDPADALAEQLRAGRVLLVFDNCEHLIGEAARVADRLLTACANVRLLATSREPLRVAGESVYRLAPLDRAAAVELFHVRAADAGRAFEREGPQAAAIAEICRRLDGIALAVELAAARVRTFSPQRLLDLIDDRFRLLRGGSRTERQRHQTLHALIDWSYDLLSVRERTVFASLSVFAGSFSIDAAGAIAIEGDDRWGALDTLAALTDKSMVVAVDAERYRLLDSMAEYARSKLRESGRLEAVAAAHARFFLRESDELAAGYGETPEEPWLARCEPDIDNFRAALEWSLGHDLEIGARIVGNLRNFWNASALDIEAMRRSEAMLAALGDRARRPEYTPVWIAVGWGAHQIFKSQRGLEIGEIALELARQSDELAWVGEALAIIGTALHRLGTDPARAHATLREVVQIFRELEKPLRGAFALIDYAASLVRSGNLEEARAALTEAREAALTSNWPRVALSAEVNLAEVEFALGRIGEACVLARRCVEMLRSGKSKLHLANALANLASYLSVSGNVDEAADAATEAIAVALPFDAEAHVAIAAQALALCEVQRGRAVRAARLLGFADGVYDRRGASREPTEATVRRATVDALQARPDAASLDREIVRGRELDLPGVERFVAAGP